MKLKLCSYAAALFFAWGAGAVQAQTAQPDAKPDAKPAKRAAAAREAKRDEEEERIEARHKAAKEKCNALSGNAKDVCEAQAKAEERIAKAELRASRNPTERNQRRAAETKVDAQYDVAREKCDDLEGERKSACQKEARATRDQAKAQIREQYAARKGESAPRAGSGSTK
jgi:hypothetical protein